MSEERLSKALAKHDYGTHSIADDHDVFIPVARRVLEPIPESLYGPMSMAAYVAEDSDASLTERNRAKMLAVVLVYRQYLLNGESE